MNELTLSNVISGRLYTKELGWHDARIVLTEEQKDAFVELFGKRCSPPTKKALRRFIEYPNGHESYRIYSRVIFTEQGCIYQAGRGNLTQMRSVL